LKGDKGVNKVSTLVALIFIASSFALGNEIGKQDAASRVIGTWNSQAEVDGHPQAVLTIKKADDKLGGSFVFRGLTVNGQENITFELLLTDVSFDGRLLSCKVIFPAPEKTVTEWEMKLRGDDEAGFTIVKEAGKHVEEGPFFILKRAAAR
jgi:hypothetical protein